MEVISSERNRSMVHFGEFLYWREREKRGRTYWRCVFFQAGEDGSKSSRCPGRAVSWSENNFNVTQEHNHRGNKARVDLKRMQGSVQAEAKTSKALPRVIIKEQILKVGEDAKPFIRRSNIGRNIRNMRHKANVEPNDPKTLQELIVPEEYRKCGAEIFLKFDGWNGKERILIFTTDACLKFMVAIKEWGADATFDVVPLLFGQLWILFVRLAHTYVPMVFVLMGNRKESSYLFVLNELTKLKTGLMPTSVAVDFERGEWNAFEKTFPGIKQRACFFHLQKSIVRNVFEDGDKKLYDTDSKFRQIINYVAALAFVPLDKLSDVFEELRQQMESSIYKDQMERLLDYFENNYIGRPTMNNKRRKPNFLPEKWSVNSLVKSDEPRTNNSIEAFNGQLSRSMAASHPTIWKLIVGLRSEVSLAQQRIVSYWAGQKTPKRSRIYKEVNECLKNTVARFEKIPAFEYLKAIAVNLGQVSISAKAKEEIKKKDQSILKRLSKLPENIKAKMNTEQVRLDDVEIEDFAFEMNDDDLNCLQPGKLLNDKVINRYLELIQIRSKDNGNLPKVYCFDTHFYNALEDRGPEGVAIWTKNINMFDYDLIMIPVHSPMHWSLGVINIQAKNIKYYDSWKNDGCDCSERLRQFVGEHSLNERRSFLNLELWTCDSPMDVPKQTNGWDCGVFLCCFAECLSRVAAFDFSQDVMNDCRKRCFFLLRLDCCRLISFECINVMFIFSLNKSVKKC